MPIKRRDLLVLVSIWSVGCLVVATLIGIFYANSSADFINPPTPQPATFMVEFSGISAKDAYILSLQEAQDWREDATMIAVSTSWPVAETASDLGQPSAWDFRFFSPERRRIFFSTVTAEEETVGRAHLFEQKYGVSLVDMSSWVLDSEQALELWINQGGGTFIEEFPGSRVEMLLHQPPNSQIPVWNIIGLTEDQSQIFFLAINAETGEIINR